MGSKNQQQHHFILPTQTILLVGAVLLVFTGVTVGIAHVDLGRFNFIIAVAVATLKAVLVGLFFMNLRHETAENAMIFVTSFVFLAIFMVLTSMDLFFRGDVYMKKGASKMAASTAPSEYEKPWISTPELVARGKELFAQQCVSCHGAQGHGDGPAAATSNPHPRNFTVLEGWKNGRRPTMIFKTLKEGLPPSSMASYATLNVDDRWGLVHFVLSLGGEKYTADTPEDFVRVGLDPKKWGGGGEKRQPTVPVDVAMETSAQPDEVPHAQWFHGDFTHHPQSTYDKHCLKCHNTQGQGGIRVQALGVQPVAFVTTLPFQKKSSSLKSETAFTQTLVRGLPGSMMPGFGHLSRGELRELYQDVLSKARD